MARRFELVCVDATDTLLRVRGSVGAVYAPIAARHGMQADVATLDGAFRAALAAAPQPVFGRPDADALPGLEREWWRAVVARTLAPLDRAPGFDAFFAEVFALFRTAAPWELLPGAREALSALRADGRRLGIVSEMDSRLHDVLAALEVAALFDCIALAPRLDRIKQDGGLFRAAVAQAGVAADRTAHIGDSVRADVQGARAAGMTPIHFDAADRRDTPPAVHAVRAWSEVPALLRALEV